MVCAPIEVRGYWIARFRACEEIEQGSLCDRERHFAERNRKMNRQIVVVLCSAAVAIAASSPLAIAQQKSIKACLEEWRANRAANIASGVTPKAYLAQCRGSAANQTAAGSPTPAGGGGGRDRQANTSLKDLMESIVDPSADVLWGAVGTVVDKEGIHETLPKTQDDWHDVRRAAVRMIEGANLLMVPGREAAPPGTKSETPGVELEPPQIAELVKKKRKSFDAFAKDLRDLGFEALRASDAQNIDALMEVGGRMENVCEGCHQTFWYPPQ
jgi:hypothetical protein